MLILAQQGLSVGPVQSWQQANQAQRSLIVRSIVKDCKLAPGSLKLKRDGELIMQPAPDTDYQTITCMVDRVKRQIGFHKVGIVGNAQVVEEKK